MKSLWILLLFSTHTLALPWFSDMHHIEPLFNESQDAVKETNNINCQATEVSPLRYISPAPRTEAWRSYYKVPKLLHENLYKVKDVCEEAKRMNASQAVTKKYALIAHKTHLCDVGHRACLSTFKSVSDPCNNFVQDNFQVFHTRTFIGQHRPKANQAIMDEYGNMGPSLLVINLENCELMPTENGKKALKSGMAPKVAVKDNYYYTPPSMDGAKDDKDVYKFKSDDDQVRFSAMREALTTNIPELKLLAENKKNDCFENNQRTLAGISDTEVVKYGEIEVKGAIAIRKLLDEQYIDQTGINPYDQGK
jgi:hypothetical protein